MSVQPREVVAHLARCHHGSLDYGELGGLGLSPEGVVDFSVNTNPLGPSPSVSAAMAKVPIGRYPDDEAMHLRRALACHHGVGLENIIVGNGSVELIRLAALAYVEPGEAVVVLNPTFGEYEVAGRIMGGNVVEERSRAQDDFRPDVEAALVAARLNRAKLVFLCNPNNPTGTYQPKEEVEVLAYGARRSLVVVDEAYVNFVANPWPSENLIRSDNVLLLRSMTKDYALTGLRIGYGIADAGVIDALKKVRPPWSVNSVAQAAALVSLQDTEHLARSLAEIEKGKRYLLQELPRLGLQVLPSQANFLLMRVGNARGFRLALLRKGFCVRDCTSFGLPEHVRLGVRTLPECRRLVAAVMQVQAAGEEQTVREEQTD